MKGIVIPKGTVCETVGVDGQVIEEGDTRTTRISHLQYAVMIDSEKVGFRGNSDQTFLFYYPDGKFFELVDMEDYEAVQAVLSRDAEEEDPA